MEPRRFLRVEGFAVLVIALGGYLALDGPLWLLAVLALAPDRSMLSYLGGPRVGSLGYNVVHTYALPPVPGAMGLRVGGQLPLLVALVWAGHIGADRAFGYGLKSSRDSRTPICRPSPSRRRCSVIQSDEPPCTCDPT